MSMQVPSILFSPAPGQGITAIRPSVPAGAPSGQPAATTSVSPWAVLLSKLEQLQRTDPAAFGQVTGQMASTVTAGAAATIGDDKQALTKLADQLNQASKTGDVSVIKPPKHHHHQAATSPTGSAVPSLLQSLLDQIDHVLGPDATPATDL